MGEAALLGVVPVVLLIACDADPATDGSTVLVRDSAGVEIVSTSQPLSPGGSLWAIGELPKTEIGVGLGDESYSLYRVAAAIRLGDGRIVIANGGTSQLRVYDGDGRHVQDVGREGDGPGEFRYVSRLWVTDGDSIMAYDGVAGRITVFDSSLRLGRTLQLRPQDGAAQVGARGLLGHGHLVVEGVVRPDEGPRPGIFSGGSRVFSRWTLDGTFVNRIDVKPAGLNWGFTTQGRLSYTSAPFSIQSPPSAVAGNQVLIGDGTESEFETRSGDGALVRVTRWGASPRSVNAEVAERHRGWQRSLSDDPRYGQRVEDMLDGLVFPETMPVYDRMLVDPEGCVWVKRYQPPWTTEHGWWVFDAAGRWLGEPPIPSDLAVLDIGVDYVLGVRRDAVETEIVALYELRRDGGRCSDRAI